jgi:predicted nucleic-acid-binding Zn-ribbon protein
MKIFCDKCGSDEVKVTCLDPPKERDYTMTEYANRPKFVSVPAVITYHHYALTCLNCGYRIEYVA